MHTHRQLKAFDNKTIWTIEDIVFEDVYREDVIWTEKYYIGFNDADVIIYVEREIVETLEQAETCEV